MKKGILRRMIDKIKEFAIVISTTGKLAVGKLKNGGWKGSMLALSGTVATFATVLTACVNEPDVKIETITDKEKVESLVSENFSVENAVKDEMQKQFGKLENFTFENGVAKAVVTKDGEKYNAEVAINVDANDFKVEKYTNAKEVADDGSLHFYLDGKLTSEKVGGIVVEVGKDTYVVVDPTDFYIEISMAVSDASLKKVETEKPDPEEPENPGDPTDPENPDPEEPENPGGEDKPDPDDPENPGDPTDPENPDPENPENPTDPEEPENPGGEENPDPEEPENPDSQIETIDDINVIEQLLSQKDLTIEALAKAAATAFYGQDNVSNLSYQNGIVSGQAKTAEGTVNFSANLDLSATDFEGKFYAGAELSADGKTFSFYQNGTLATLTITEDMAVIETADGVNILDTAAAEQMVVNKFETTNNETSVPSQDITFDSWEELMNAGDGVVKDAVFEILKDNLLTESVIKSMFGNSMKPENLEDGTIEILKWGFDTNDQNEITAIEVMGVRTGAQTNKPDSKQLQTASFTLQTPVKLSAIQGSSVVVDSNNVVSYPDQECEIKINLDAFAAALKNATHKNIARHTISSQTLTEENQQYFDLCMQLAVEKGYSKQDAELAFVTVTSGTTFTDEFEEQTKTKNAIQIQITFVDIKENKQMTIKFLFPDTRNSETPMVDEIEKALDLDTPLYKVIVAETKNIMSESDMNFEFDLNNVVIYQIPQKEGENQA